MQPNGTEYKTEDFFSFEFSGWLLSMLALKGVEAVALEWDVSAATVRLVALDPGMCVISKWMTKGRLI